MPEDTRPLRILNLEDSPLDAELLHATLIDGGIACEVLRVQTRAEFIAALENEDFDIILADYSLPSFDGLSALKIAQEIRPGVPFVLVSGMLGEERAIEALKSGATDYVLKERLERIVPAVRRGVREAEERIERRRAEEALKESEERFRATFEQAAVGIGHVDIEGRFLRVNQKFCDIVGYAREELLEKTFQDITHPDEVALDLGRFHRLLAGEIETYSIEKRYIHKSGSVVWIHLTVSLVGDPSGNPKYVMGVIEDVTERKGAEEELQARHRQQAAVANLGQLALSNVDLQALMDKAAALVTWALDVEYCKILELLPDGDTLLLRSGVGWREGLVGTTTVGAGLGSQAGYALLSKEPVIVENLRTEERFSGPPLLYEHAVTSGMSTIIQSQDKPFGVIGAHTKNLRIFTEDDVNFLQAVANVLATAVERKNTEEEMREIRQAERSRIARDLHDEALQDLIYALQQIKTGQIPSEDGKQDGTLKELSDTLQRSVEGLRGAIYDLRLGDREQSFAELLESLVDLNRRSSPEQEIELFVEEGFTPPPSKMKQIELLRIIREALANVRRHSETEHVRVALSSSDERLRVEVSDDGRGFDPQKGTSGGIGIRGMRERTRMLGGELTIESEPGKGTKICLEIALERREEDLKDVGARILLIEDHTSFRQATASVLEKEAGFSIVGEAGSLSEAREMLDAEVDVAIVDLALPDGYGGELIKELRDRNPQAQALVLSASLDQAEIARAVENGAAGVLHKSADIEEVVEAVRRLRAGKTLMPLEEVVELLRYAGTRREKEYEAHQAIAQLTPREKEVLQALAEGLDGQEIADRLHISLKTERNHVASILNKLGVHSQLQALVFGLRYGVVDLR